MTIRDVGLSSLRAQAVAVLASATADTKCKAAAAASTALARGVAVCADADTAPPDVPARPAHPVLLAPGKMPRRSTGVGTAGRVALLHAIAHIEFNAIDLAFDIVARFATPALPRAFTADWIRIGAEEAKHFELICTRLHDLGAAYGDLPAHDGLWQSAQATAHNLTARLAVVPMVLEARGLDVTPAMIEKLRRSGDDPSADVLAVIYRDEISHVAAGRRWFDFACAREGKEPAATWQSLVAAHHTAGVKAPVNADGRDAAGFPRRYYEPMVR